jgi:AcrR family transcriptional regulator
VPKTTMRPNKNNKKKTKPPSPRALADTDDVLAARRVPTQDRSRQRVERILDAAAEIFADIGYDAATTDAIALRAGTSIGSLYQFFPNKQALYNAIADRHLSRARVVFDALMTPDALMRPWQEILDASVDAFSAFDRTDKDFRAVWINWHLSGEFLVAGQALNREFAMRTEAVLAQQSRSLTPARRALVATVMVEVMSAMLFLAARKDHDAAEKIVAETKVLLRRYLEPYTDDGAGEKRNASAARRRKA